MNEDLVTVATFPNTQLAYLAMQHLQGSGIRSFVAEENTSGLFSSAMVWVKLQVAKDDALRAAAVLEAEMPHDPVPSEEIMVPEDTVTRRDQIAATDPDDAPEEQVRRAAILTEDESEGSETADREQIRPERAPMSENALIPIMVVVVLGLGVVFLWVLGTVLEWW